MKILDPPLSVNSQVTYQLVSQCLELYLLSCCGSVDPIRPAAGSGNSALGKALSPHCLVPRKGLKDVVPLVGWLLAYKQPAFLVAR